MSARVGIALACGLTAAYLALEGLDAERVQRANERGLAGDYDGAVSEASRVSGSPADVRALQAIANAHFAAGRLEDAARAFTDLARRDPENWIVHSELARVLLAKGDRRAARRAFDRAKQLNPALPPLPQLD